MRVQASLGRLLQIPRDQLELLQRGLQVFHNFLRNHLGRGQLVPVGQAVVFEPKNVQAGLVAGDQLVMAVGAPTAISTRVLVVVFMVDSKAAKRSICWPPAGKP